MDHIEALREKLKSLDHKLSQSVNGFGQSISDIHPGQKLSAINLLHYMALRCEDIRSLQDELHILGLSSLSSSESHIRRQLQSIRERLGSSFLPEELSQPDYENANKISYKNRLQLFGNDNIIVPNVMVTMTQELADDSKILGKLLQAGMNIARINCAHDDEDVWSHMIKKIRQSGSENGIPYRIYMDIPGPKMRTTLLGLGQDGKKIPLYVGQTIVFAENKANFDKDSVVIGCQEPGVVGQLKIGDRVLFDDGQEEAKVVACEKDMAILKMVRVYSDKSRIKEEKGINLPDTGITLPSLTDHDKSVMPFICAHADMVGYSFVRNAGDIQALQALLQNQEKTPDIIIKIETAEAVQNLPELILQAMKSEVFGVMIARGDLAVEIGFERMSEIQEEILWICEAAHVPVIWATQVLETLNKHGIATRAEVTDASHAVMADCVLLNKGNHILKVMNTLREILNRSGSHHIKKRYSMRPMRIAEKFFHQARKNLNNA